jgi:hypothetical protein
MASLIKFNLFYILVTLSIYLSLSPSSNLAHAGYSFALPTASSRWSIGQPGKITIKSTDTGGDNGGNRFLTLSLRQTSGNVFVPDKQLIVIADRFSVIVQPPATEATQDIDWVVPSSIPEGAKYYVYLERTKDGLFDIPDKEKSPEFSIVAAAAPTSGNSKRFLTYDFHVFSFQQTLYINKIFYMK